MNGLGKNSSGITGNMLLMTMVLYSEVGDNSRCYGGKRMVMLWHVNECRFVYKVTNTISLLCRRRSNEGHFNVDIISEHYLLNECSTI